MKTMMMAPDAQSIATVCERYVRISFKLAKKSFLKVVSSVLILIFTSTQIIMAAPDPYVFLDSKESEVAVESVEAEPSKLSDHNGFLNTTTGFLSMDNPLSTVTGGQSSASGEEAEGSEDVLEASSEPSQNLPRTQSYEFERYSVEDALPAIQNDVATAFILDSIDEKSIEHILDLDVEVGIAALHGELILFTTGNEEEIGILPAAKSLLEEASFISHTHVADSERAQSGPSSVDLQNAVKAPEMEYVLTQNGAYAYNREGTHGRVSHKEYLHELVKALQDGMGEVSQVEVRAELNEFIYQMDRYNEASEEDRELWRASTNPNLQAYWSFDSATVADGHSSGDNDAISSSATLDTNEKPAEVSHSTGSLSFNGTNQYIEIADTPDLAATEFTLSFWMNADSFTGTGVLFSRRDPVSSEWKDVNYQVSVDGGNGQLRVLYFNPNGSQLVDLYSTGVDLRNGWHHVAIFRSTATNTLEIYIDGQPNASTPAIYFPETSGTQTFAIGKNPNGGTPYYYKGHLDEVYFYNSAIPPTEITDLSQGNSQIAPSDTVAPVISNVTTSSVTENSITVTWTTDEPATSALEYGTTSTLDTVLAPDSVLRTSHSIEITGLNSETQYFFKAISKDAATNPAESTIQNATTTAAVDNIPPSGTPDIVETGPTNNPQITINVDAIADNSGGSGLKEFYIREVGSASWGNPYTVFANTTFTLSAGSGQKDIEVRVCDQLNNCTDPALSAGVIYFDEDVPSGAIEINNNAATTDNAFVTVSFNNFLDNHTATVNLQYKIREQSSATWGPYAAFPTNTPPSVNFTLSSGFETKTIEVMIKDEAGNESVVLVDTIDFIEASTPTLRAPSELPSTNMVAYFNFDQDGTQFSDLSANGNVNTGYANGTIHQNVDPNDVPPSNITNGGNLWFDGANGSYVGINDSSSLNLGTHTERSISVWFKVDDASIATKKQVIYEEGGAARGLSIYIHNNHLYVGGWNDDSSQSNWTGTFLSKDLTNLTRPANDWHHVTLTLNGGASLSTDSFKGYLDGVLFGSGNGSQLWERIGNIGIGGVDDGTKFHDGAYNTPTGHGFKGFLDEVRIYNHELTQLEIDDLVEQGSVTPTNTAPVVGDVSHNATDRDGAVAGNQVYEGDTITLSADVTDANGDALTWQWVQRVNSTETNIAPMAPYPVLAYDWTVPADSVGSTYEFFLRASDGTEVAVNTPVSFTVIATPPAEPVIVNLIEDDFSTDTSADYSPVVSGPSYWDADLINGRLYSYGADNNYVKFTRNLDQGVTNAHLEIDLHTIRYYPEGGWVVIQFKQDDDNYYEVAITDPAPGATGYGPLFIKRYTTGNPPTFIEATGVYMDQGQDYTLKMDLDENGINVDAFGGLLSDQAIPNFTLNSITFENGQQDLYLDRFLLTTEVDGNSGTDASPSVIHFLSTGVTNDSQYTLRYSINGSTVIETPYSLNEGLNHFEVTEIVNNQTITAVHTVELDTQKPQINLVSPTITNTSDYWLEYEVDGVLKTEFKSLTEGTNIFPITEYDEAGNGETINVEIVLDTLKPEIVMTSAASVTHHVYDLVFEVDGAEETQHVRLEEGINRFEIERTDEAGNTKAEVLEVSYHPVSPLSLFSTHQTGSQWNAQFQDGLPQQVSNTAGILKNINWDSGSSAIIDADFEDVSGDLWEIRNGVIERIIRKSGEIEIYANGLIQSEEFIPGETVVYSRGNLPTESSTHPIAFYGNSAVGSGHLGQAMIFDGTDGAQTGSGSSVLVSPDHADWNFLNDDFTIDFWMSLDDLSNQGIFYRALNSDNYMNFSFENGSLVFEVQRNNISEVMLTSTWSPTVADWNHIALIRKGNALKLMVNGSEAALVQIEPAWNFEDLSGNFGFAHAYNSSTSGDGFLLMRGALDEFRISKGIARWDAENFTPEVTSYTADPYTRFLHHFDQVGDAERYVNPDLDFQLTKEYFKNGQSLGVDEYAVDTSGKVLDEYQNDISAFVISQVKGYTQTLTLPMAYLDLAASYAGLRGVSVNLESPSMLDTRDYDLAFSVNGQSFERRSFLEAGETSIYSSYTDGNASIDFNWSVYSETLTPVVEQTSNDISTTPHYALNYTVDGNPETEEVKLTPGLNTVTKYHENEWGVTTTNFVIDYQPITANGTRLTYRDGLVTELERQGHKVSNPQFNDLGELTDGLFRSSAGDAFTIVNGEVTQFTQSNGTVLNFEDSYVTQIISDLNATNYERNLEPEDYHVFENLGRMESTENAFGTYGVFNGNDMRIEIPDHDDFNFEDQDFTIDLRVFFEQIENGGFITQGDTNNYWSLGYFDGKLVWEVKEAGQEVMRVTSDWNPKTDLWYHIAVVRTEDRFKLFVNGQRIGDTFTLDHTFSNYAGNLEIGTGRVQGGASNDLFKGRIDEVRVSKGIARWKLITFDVPQEKYEVDSDTTFLHRFNQVDLTETGAYPDEASNPHTVTEYGSVLLDGLQEDFGTQGFFNGHSKATLVTEDHRDWMLDDTWTIEMQANMIDPSEGQSFISSFDESGENGWEIRYDSSGHLRLEQKVNGSLNINLAWSWIASKNTWHHIALVRDGNNLSLFIDGAYNTTLTAAPSTLDVDGGNLYIGNGYEGFLDEVRISDNVRYTSGQNFSVATAPHELDDDTLLLHHFDDLYHALRSTHADPLYSLKIYDTAASTSETYWVSATGDLLDFHGNTTTSVNIPESVRYTNQTTVSNEFFKAGIPLPHLMLDMGYDYFDLNVLPAVTINSDTLVNQSSYTLEYEFNGSIYTEPFTLTEGKNVLEVPLTGDLGLLKKEFVTVMLDETNPDVVVTSNTMSYQPNYVFRYTVDGEERTENIRLDVGINSITRTITDEAGNTTLLNVDVTYEVPLQSFTESFNGDGYLIQLTDNSTGMTLEYSWNDEFELTITDSSIPHTEVLNQTVNRADLSEGLAVTLEGGIEAIYLNEELAALRLSDGTELQNLALDSTGSVISADIFYTDGRIDRIRFGILLQTHLEGGMIRDFDFDGNRVREVNGNYVRRYEYIKNSSTDVLEEVRVHLPDGTVQIYDGEKDLSELVRANGSRTLFQDGMISSLLEADGKNYEYDSGQEIIDQETFEKRTLNTTTSSNPDEKTPVEIFYHISGELSKMILHDGTVVNYFNGVPTEIQDHLGEISTLEYLEQSGTISGLIVSQDEVGFEYDQTGVLSKIQTNSGTLEIDQGEVKRIFSPDGTIIENFIEDSETGEFLEGTLVSPDGTKRYFENTLTQSGKKTELVAIKYPDGTQASFTNGSIETITLTDGRVLSNITLDSKGEFENVTETHLDGIVLTYSANELVSTVIPNFGTVTYTNGMMTEFTDTALETHTVEPVENVEGDLLHFLVTSPTGIERIFSPDAFDGFEHNQTRYQHLTAMLESNEPSVLTSHFGNISKLSFNESDELTSGMLTRSDGAKTEIEDGNVVKTTLLTGEVIEYDENRMSALETSSGRFEFVQHDGGTYVKYKSEDEDIVESLALFLLTPERDRERTILLSEPLVNSLAERENASVRFDTGSNIQLALLEEDAERTQAYKFNSTYLPRWGNVDLNTIHQGAIQSLEQLQDWDDLPATLSDFVDMNGDALPDRVLFDEANPSQYLVQLNSGSGFEDVTIWDNVEYDLSDFFASGSSQKYSADHLRNGSLMFWEGRHPHKLAEFIDMNGDGLPDRVINGPLGESHWVVQFNNGVDGFEEPIRWEGAFPSARVWSYQAPYAIEVRNDENANDGDPGIEEMMTDLLDMNGDGRPDRVIIAPNDPYDYWFVQFNTGTGFEFPIVWKNVANNFFHGEENLDGSLSVTENLGGTQTLVSAAEDINGDGKVDRIFTKYRDTLQPHLGVEWFVQINNGEDGFNDPVLFDADVRDMDFAINASSAESIRYLYDRLGERRVYVELMDINNDGFKDRITIDHSDYSVWWVELNEEGSGFADPVMWAGVESIGAHTQAIRNDNELWVKSYDTDYGRLQFETDLIDVNGDLLPDRVMFQPGNPEWLVQFNNGGGFEPLRAMHIDALLAEANVEDPAAYDFIHVSLRLEEAPTSPDNFTNTDDVKVKIGNLEFTVAGLSSEWSDFYLPLEGLSFSPGETHEVILEAASSLDHAILVDNITWIKQREISSKDWMKDLLLSTSQIPTLKQASSADFSVLGDYVLEQTRNWQSAAQVLETQTRFHYSSAGELTQVDIANGSVAEFSQEKMTKIIHADNTSVDLTYDINGELEQTQTFEGSNLTHVSNFSYGKVRSIDAVDADEDDYAVTYEFDGKGRELQVIVDPETGDTLKYNGEQLVSVLKQNGVESRYTYNEKDELIESSSYYKGILKNTVKHNTKTAGAESLQNTLLHQTGVMEERDDEGQLLYHTLPNGLRYRHEYVYPEKVDETAISDPENGDIDGVDANVTTYDVTITEDTTQGKVHRVILEEKILEDGSRASYIDGMLSTVTTAEGNRVIWWFDEVDQKNKVKVDYADGVSFEFHEKLPYKVSALSGEERIFTRHDDTFDFHYSEALKTWDFVQEQAEVFALADNDTVIAEFQLDDNDTPVSQWTASGAAQLYNVYGQLETVLDVEGNVQARYEYHPTTGYLTKVTLEHMRDYIPDEMARIRAEIEKERVRALERLREREFIVEETTVGSYEANLERLERMRERAEESRRELAAIQIPRKGKAAKEYINGLIQDVDFQIQTINGQIEDLAKTKAAALKDLDEVVSDAHAQIESEYNRSLAEIAEFETQNETEIIAQEVTPVVMHYYRVHLGRDPSATEVLEELEGVGINDLYDVADLEVRLLAKQELNDRQTEVLAIQTAVRSFLETYVDADEAAQTTMLSGLGLTSDEVVNLKENVSDDSLEAILDWLDNQSLHFGQSAFLALEALLEEAGQNPNRINLATDLIVMDIFFGVITPHEESDLVISMYAMNRYAEHHGVSLNALKLTYEDLLAMYVEACGDNTECEINVVAHVDTNHYVIVKKVTADAITFLNPGQGAENSLEMVTLERGEFVAEWEGAALTARAPPENSETARELTIQEQKSIRGAFFGIFILAALLTNLIVFSALVGINFITTLIATGSFKAAFSNTVDFLKLVAFGDVFGAAKLTLDNVFSAMEKVATLANKIIPGLGDVTLKVVEGGRKLTNWVYDNVINTKVFRTVVDSIKIVAGLVLAIPTGGASLILVGQGLEGILNRHTNLSPTTIKFISLGTQLAGGFVANGFAVAGNAGSGGFLSNFTDGGVEFLGSEVGKNLSRKLISLGVSEGLESLGVNDALSDILGGFAGFVGSNFVGSTLGGGAGTGAGGAGDNDRLPQLAICPGGLESNNDPNCADFFDNPLPYTEADKAGETAGNLLGLENLLNSLGGFFGNSSGTETNASSDPSSTPPPAPDRPTIEAIERETNLEGIDAINSNDVKQLMNEKYGFDEFQGMSRLENELNRWTKPNEVAPAQTLESYVNNDPAKLAEALDKHSQHFFNLETQELILKQSGGVENAVQNYINNQYTNGNVINRSSLNSLGQPVNVDTIFLDGKQIGSEYFINLDPNNHGNILRIQQGSSSTFFTDLRYDASTGPVMVSGEQILANTDASVTARALIDSQGINSIKFQAGGVDVGAILPPVGSGQIAFENGKLSTYAFYEQQGNHTTVLMERGFAESISYDAGSFQAKFGDALPERTVPIRISVDNFELGGDDLGIKARLKVKANVFETIERGEALALESLSRILKDHFEASFEKLGEILTSKEDKDTHQLNLEDLYRGGLPGEVRSEDIFAQFGIPKDVELSTNDDFLRIVPKLNQTDAAITSITQGFVRIQNDFTTGNAAIATELPAAIEAVNGSTVAGVEGIGKSEIYTSAGLRFEGEPLKPRPFVTKYGEIFYDAYKGLEKTSPFTYKFEGQARYTPNGVVADGVNMDQYHLGEGSGIMLPIGQNQMAFYEIANDTGGTQWLVLRYYDGNQYFENRTKYDFKVAWDVKSEAERLFTDRYEELLNEIKDQVKGGFNDALPGLGDIFLKLLPPLS